MRVEFISGLLLALNGDRFGGMISHEVWLAIERHDLGGKGMKKTKGGTSKGAAIGSPSGRQGPDHDDPLTLVWIYSPEP